MRDDLRQEPYAGNPPVRIRAGDAEQSAALPRHMGDMKDLDIQVQNLLAAVPENQRQAAASLLAQYGPRFFDLAKADAWQYLRRLMAGDVDVVSELDSQLSNDEFIAKVKANTARWEAVANYNKVRDDLKNEILLRLVPIVGSLLAALVGL